jgi:predicted kinase
MAARQTRYLFLVVGFLGSGKSYVSRWLAPHTGSVYLRLDELRWVMFGEDRPELYTPENKTLVNNAASYAAQQVLASGQAHVVYDGNNIRTREVREQLAAAVKGVAVTVVVWVDTPLKDAKQRTVERVATEGHVLFEPGLVEKMAAQLEPPAERELSIRIDGLLDASEQQKQFDGQFLKLQQDRLQ